MLKTFLTNIRKQRIVGSTKAVQQLNQGWTVSALGKKQSQPLKMISNLTNSCVG
jgi:hypothetical protein